MRIFCSSRLHRRGQRVVWHWHPECRCVPPEATRHYEDRDLAGLLCSELCDSCLAREAATQPPDVCDEFGSSLQATCESMLRAVPHWFDGTREAWEFLVRMNFADIVGDPRDGRRRQYAV